MQIIIHGKREIRFPASEINDGQLSPAVEPRQDIFYEFEEAVDLPELIGLRPDDLTVCSHHTQILQKRDRDPFLQNILLFSVVGKIRFFRRCLPFSSLDRNFPLPAHKHCTVLMHCLDLHLPEVLHVFQDLFRRLFPAQVFVKRLCFCEGFDLKMQISLCLHRSDFHLYYSLFFHGITYDRPDKIYI